MSDGQSQSRQLGALLRKSRMDKGLSLDEIAASTRVPRTHLESIEKGDLDALPPGPFAKGFVVAYARQVGVDQQHVSDLMDGDRSALQKTPEKKKTGEEGEPEKQSSRKKWIGVLAAVFVLSIPLGWGLFSQSSSPVADEPTPPSLVLSAVEEGPSAEGSSLLRLGAVEDGAGDTFYVFSDSERGKRSHKISLKAVHRSYFRVTGTFNGALLAEGLLEGGESKDISSEDELWLVLGNAGAVELSYLGNKLTNLGPDGERRGFAFRGP